MFKRLINNWPDKLMAIALTLILFYYVRNQQNTVHSTLVLPLSAPAPAGMRVVEPSPGTSVRVDLEGPGDAVRELDSQDSQDVKVAIDTSLLRPGVSIKLPVTVEIPDKFRKRGVDVVRWRPGSVQAKMVSDASKELPIVAKVLNHPDGWQLTDTPQVTPDRARVTGLQADVDRVVTIVAPFELEPKEKISTTAILEALDSNNVEVRDVRVTPVEALVAGVQEHVVLQKQLAVQPIFHAPPGERLAVTVDPPRVAAVGPEEALRGVYVVETEPFEVPAGQAQFSKEVALVVPREGAQLQVHRVKVTIRVQAAGHGAKPQH